jgi:hypothetical protein
MNKQFELQVEKYTKDWGLHLTNANKTNEIERQKQLNDLKIKSENEAVILLSILLSYRSALKITAAFEPRHFK